MAEMDILELDDVRSLSWATLDLHTRLLVCQNLGSRASSLPIKARKLLHMLSLEPRSELILATVKAQN